MSANGPMEHKTEEQGENMGLVDQKIKNNSGRGYFVYLAVSIGK